MLNYRTKGYEKKDKDGNPTGKFTNAQNNYTYYTYSKALAKQISKTEKRIAELNHLIKKLYEDNVSGKLSNKRFEMLSGDYEAEQTELEDFLTTANEKLATAKSEASTDNTTEKEA